jgi:hypothetical protein
MGSGGTYSLWPPGKIGWGAFQARLMESCTRIGVFYPANCLGVIWSSLTGH